MAEIIEKSKYVTDVWYERSFEFEGEPNCGYGFDCDKNGNLSPNLCEAAIENYKMCLNTTVINGKKLIDRGVKKHNHTYRVPTRLKCDCGEIISLVNECMGACSCPVCEQWYNLFGQKLLPPRIWEDDY